jgi:hypothetical protein
VVNCADGNEIHITYFCSKWWLLCSSWERRNYSALYLFLWLGRQDGLNPLPDLPALRKNTCTKYIGLRCFATRHKICKRAENEASSRNGQLFEFAQQVSCLSLAEASVSSSVSVVSSSCTRYNRSWVFAMISPAFLTLDLDIRFHQSLGSVHLYGGTTAFGKREFMTKMCRILRCDKQNTLMEFEPSFRKKSHHFRQRPLNSTYIIQLPVKKNK